MADMAAVSTDTLSNQIDVFYGEMSDSVAKIYVRARGRELQDVQLRGVVRGPACEFSHTLTFDVPLVSLGEGASPLAAATLPDPCPWTPELPMLYEVTVEVRGADGEVLGEVKRSLGLRPLGARERDLFLAGRRWVVRGGRLRSVGLMKSTEEDTLDADSLRAWRDAHAAMLVEEPGDAICAAASRQGVLLIATISDVGCGELELQERLRRLGRWPAVAMVVLASAAPVTQGVRQSVSNLLFAERISAGGDHAVAQWADLVLCEGSAAEVGATSTDREVPVLAAGPAEVTFQNVMEARGACDKLQGALAPYGDFAGYLV